jgi:hypothetical protein
LACTQEQLWVGSCAWEAFLTFAPYAYDASVWDDGADELLALNDCAEATVASLTADQAEAVGCVIGHGRVVPVKDWRKRRRAQRHRRAASTPSPLGSRHEQIAAREEFQSAWRNR